MVVQHVAKCASVMKEKHNNSAVKSFFAVRVESIEKDLVILLPVEEFFYNTLITVSTHYKIAKNEFIPCRKKIVLIYKTSTNLSHKYFF